MQESWLKNWHREQRKMHEPVLIDQVVKGLHLKNQARYIDATVGGGGHAAKIIEKGGVVLGIDIDESMLSISKKRLQKAYSPKHFKLVEGNFRKIDEIAKREGFAPADGIIFDLGVSSAHFSSPNRGFSFQEEGALLDMRLNPESQRVSAADLLNILRPDQLKQVFGEVMGKMETGRFAEAIVKQRRQSPFRTVGDFLQACKVLEKKRLHPATKAFLALRIKVNSELENLREGLPKAFSILKPGARLLVISFHSLEDVIVKAFFKEKAKANLAYILSKKPIRPSPAEVRNNPKSRSAKLRILKKK